MRPNIATSIAGIAAGCLLTFALTGCCCHSRCCRNERPQQTEESVEAAPLEMMGTDYPRFHPVPTRPVFAPQGIEMAPETIEPQAMAPETASPQTPPPRSLPPQATAPTESESPSTLRDDPPQPAVTSSPTSLKWVPAPIRSDEAVEKAEPSTLVPADSARRIDSRRGSR